MGITPEIILKIVSKYFSMPAKQIFFNTRKRHIITKRQLFFYFCAIYTDTSYEEIGFIGVKYGRKNPFDHATVLHSKKTIVNLIETDKTIRTHANQISKAIEARFKEPVFEIDVEEKISNLEKSILNLEGKVKDLEEWRHEAIKNIEVDLQAV